MPLWAIIYLFLFVAISIAGDVLNFRNDGFRWGHTFDFVAHLIFAITFAGYWLSAIFDTVGLIAPVLFVAALSWEIYSGPADLREIWRDPDLSRTERIGLTFSVPMLAWPIYITGAVGLFKFYDRA